LASTTLKIKAMKSSRNVIEANAGFKGRPVVICMNQCGLQQACAFGSGDITESWKVPPAIFEASQQPSEMLRKFSFGAFVLDWFPGWAWGNLKYRLDY
jgi:hypothetical protein